MHKNARELLAVIGIFVLALIIRVISLGLYLTADEPRAWFGRSINFARAITEGRLADTYFSYTPGVTLTWSGGIGLYLNYLFVPGQSTEFRAFLQQVPFDPVDPSMVFWFQLPNVLIGAFCLAIAYPFAKRLTGSTIAFVGILLIVVDPFVIGMTRVVSNDGAAASFLLVSILASILFFLERREKVSYGILVISGIAAGLAILSKFTAFFLLPYLGLVVVTTVATCRQWGKFHLYVVDMMIWSIVAILTIVILWPALWFHPIETIQKILIDLELAVGEPHNRGSFFLGKPVPDPGIWFYWIATYFRLTPVTTIGLILGLAYLFSRDRILPGLTRSRKKMVVFLLVSFVIFYIFFLTLGSKKQDRYIVPLIPPTAIIAAAGYVWITDMFKRKSWQYVSLAAVISLQAAFMVSSYPYYLSHYNLLAGGSKTATGTLLVGWGEGLDQAARYLNAMPDAESVKVASWYHSTFEPYFSGQAVETAGHEKISRSAKPALASSYVVLYINQIQRLMPTPGMIQYFQSFTPEHVITIDGIDYAFIYPSPAIKHAFSGEVRLVGQAELLGYDLLDAGGQSMTELPADRTAIVQLYWEWQGKSQEEPIMLSLVDAAGRTWGLVDFLGSYAPVPAEEWLEGAIVRADFRLRPMPGTPPGTYFLKAWIDRPDTGERVGDFPLLLEDAQITITRPEAAPSVADLPLAAYIDRMAADGIKLVGPGRNEQLNESWQPGENREVVLYWQAEQDLTLDYPATLALIDGAGIRRASWFGQPGGAHFPPTAWRPGDLIRDPWDLTLPPYVPPGDYRLTIALDDEDPITLQPLSVAGRPRQFELPPLDLPTNAAYGDSIDLLGLQAATGSGSVIPGVTGQPLTLGLVWQAVNLVDRDYVVTVQLLDGQQQVLAQRDNVPLAGAAPTTSWAAGEVLVDRISLDIPPDVAAGPHQLLIALYHLESGERLRLPNGADHLTIPVVISP